MTIEQQLTTRLKEAMRSKNAAEVSVIRMIKSEATKARTAPGFDGQDGDEFWQGVIKRYVKQQKKAREEFARAETGAEERIAEIDFELGYLAEFLPRTLDENAVRDLVQQAIAQTGAAGPKMIGKVMGHVMKEHKDQVDAATVKRIAGEELG